jgi:hypothetical protein
MVVLKLNAVMPVVLDESARATIDVNGSRSKLCTSPLQLLSDRIYKRKLLNLILRKLGGQKLFILLSFPLCFDATLFQHNNYHRERRARKTFKPLNVLII